MVNDISTMVRNGISMMSEMMVECMWLAYADIVESRVTKLQCMGAAAIFFILYILVQFNRTTDWLLQHATASAGADLIQASIFRYILKILLSVNIPLRWLFLFCMFAYFYMGVKDGKKYKIFHPSRRTTLN